MYLIAIRIPEEGKSWIFTFEDDNKKSVNKIIELFNTEYYFYNVQLAICNIIKQTEIFKSNDLDNYMYKKYNYHIKYLNDILRKYSDYECENNKDIKEDVKYHKDVIRIIRSIARLNSISLAQESYEDAIYHRVPGGIFK